MAALALRSLCKAQSEGTQPPKCSTFLPPAPTGSVMLDKPVLSLRDTFLVWGLWVVLHHTRDCCMFHPPCRSRREECAAWGWRELPSCHSVAQLPFLIGKRNDTFYSNGSFPDTPSISCPLPRQQPDHFCLFWGGLVPVIPSWHWESLVV